MKIKSQTLDLIALSSSIICALHCTAIPILLSFTSFGSLHFIGHHRIEWFFIIFGLLLVAISLWPSYRNVHGKISPLLNSILGFTILGMGKFNITESWEIIFTVIGAILISFAHINNWQLVRNTNRHSHLS
ncbi:MerC domain-containing protein [Membranihabitans marinus]|uniref:MerC domain-containing protein n=1 Tax=Membranihabitans marinus TaxID=1227546 RepID=UPI001F23675B|nr:MerC domain-containing protein [Membranihabitans marinus]